jgi:hypothetical protein
LRALNPEDHHNEGTIKPVVIEKDVLLSEKDRFAATVYSKWSLL